MADIIDEAQGINEGHIGDCLARNRTAVQNMPKGEPGECFDCGEYSPRLVRHLCAPCRDERAKRRNR